MLLNKFRQWMVGRHGSDELGIALIGGSLLLNLIQTFLLRRAGVLVSILFLIASYVLAILFFFRMFSKNEMARRQENQKFLRVVTGLRGKWQLKWKHLRQRKDYHFYTCKNCGQRIRIPKGKGKICITCPKCKNEFIKNS